MLIIVNEENQVARSFRLTIGLIEGYSGGKLHTQEEVGEIVTEWLLEQKYEGEGFSEYGWGGYLIWKMPEKKVFVDGRMPSWRWDPADKTQSSWAFKDYRKIMEKADFEDFFNAFAVTSHNHLSI